MSVSTNNTGPFGSVQDVTMQNAAAAPANGTAMNVGGQAGVAFQVTGTNTGLSIAPEVNIDGNWRATQVVPVDGSSGPVTAVTTANVYWCPCAGLDQFRARVAAISTGTVTVTGKAVAVPGPSITTIGAGTATIGAVTQASGPWTQNLTQCGGTAVAAGQGLMAASIPVVIASNQSNVPTNTVQVGGTNVLTGGVAGSQGIGGLAASGATAAGNPVQLGANFQSFATLPAVTTGQAVSLQADPSGTLRTGKVPLGSIVTVAANVAAATNTQTLPAVAAKMNYLAGFALTGLGATAASGITITTTGLATNLNFVLPIPAGVTVGVSPLIVTFDPPLPASAVNTAITVVVPSYGGGNTTASACAWGFVV